MAEMSPNLLAMRQVLEKCGSGRISSDRALAEKRDCQVAYLQKPCTGRT